MKKLLIILLLFSCEPHRVVLNSSGVVVGVTENTYDAAFRDVNSQGGRFIQFLDIKGYAQVGDSVRVVIK
jgi:hypothetical protein